MVDVYKAIGIDFSPNLLIESTLVIPLADYDISTLQDDDYVLNPGLELHNGRL